MRRGIRRVPWYVAVPALVAGAATLLPIAYLILRATEADPATVARLVFRPRTWALFANTMALVGGVLALTTLLAVPLAWLVVRTDLRGRTLITWLSVVPLAIPGYVMAYALLGLGGHQGLLAQLGGWSVARPSGYLGAALALSLYTFPYLFLNVRNALLGLDPALEESARSLGQSPAATLRTVVVPQLRPALLAGWLVVALYVLGDFGVVALMRYETFSYAIYTQYTSAFDRTYAAWLALTLLAMTLSIVLLEARLLGRRRYARVGGGAARRAPTTKLGARAPLAWTWVALVLGAALGLPVLALGAWLVLAPPSLATLQAVAATFGRTAALALPAALVATVLALPIAVMGARVRSAAGHAVERLAYVGYAIPPVALALALVMFALRSAPGLYQTIPLVIAAYVISFLALAIGPVRSALLQISPRVEEAARSLGRSRFAAFAQTTLRLIGRSLAASGAMVLMVAMKELPMTFLLAPTGYTTLAVRVFSRTNEGMLAEAAPFAAAVVLFSAAFAGLLLSYEGRR